MSRVTCAAILAAGFIFLAGPAPAAEVTAGRGLGPRIGDRQPRGVPHQALTPGSNLLTMGQ